MITKVEPFYFADDAVNGIFGLALNADRTAGSRERKIPSPIAALVKNNLERPLMTIFQRKRVLLVFLFLIQTCKAGQETFAHNSLHPTAIFKL